MLGWNGYVSRKLRERRICWTYDGMLRKSLFAMIRTGTLRFTPSPQIVRPLRQKMAVVGFFPQRRKFSARNFRRNLRASSLAALMRLD
jgi:hypothetical protein